MKRKNIIKSLISVIGILAVVCSIFILNKNSKNSTIKNDFSKGVLAINTDRTEYLSKEIVIIQMSALDPQGHTLCNANLELTINGVKAKNIMKSSTCGPDNVTLNPDYFFNFLPPDKSGYRTFYRK
jgi:hypothetical protein